MEIVFYDNVQHKLDDSVKDWNNVAKHRRHDKHDSDDGIRSMLTLVDENDARYNDTYGDQNES